MRPKGKRNLTHTQRLILEDCLNAGLRKKAIAEKLGVCLATVYNEIKRGLYEHKTIRSVNYWGDKKYKFLHRYSPEKAQERYRINQTAKGAPLKLGNDFEFVRYVEKRIIKDKLSPCAVVGEIKRHKLFKTQISKTTMYRYIDSGIFMNISMSHLPVKEKRKRYRKPVAKRPPKGVSIENRPSEILSRKSFGHWEMDCVVGKQYTRNALLVLTERLTRFEIIMKIPNKTSETVVKCLNKIERKYGKRFRTTFKSITVDNGAEFSDFKGLEKSVFGGKRCSVYYCHPYTSCERGSNERMNREIRRWLPKGTDFSKVTDSFVKSVENWINSYPREIFDYATSRELFEKELKLL